MVYRPLLTLYALLCSCLAMAASPTTPNLLNDDTETFINQLLAAWGSPGGVAVAVVRKDVENDAWLVETKGYGIAKINGSKVTENTLFGIASNSKLFTVAATGLLINNSTLSPRLSWTSKIASIIPGWGLVDPIASKQATILDAMSHRTGVPRHDLAYRETQDVTDIVAKMKYLPPSAEFRDVWQYSNTMYILLSSLPKLLLPSRTPFTRYVKEHIFDPLGMSATTYSYIKANASGLLADGLGRQGVDVRTDPFGKGMVRKLAFPATTGGEDGNSLAGPGGIISNAVDLATWLQTLLQNGVKPGTNETVIPADVLEKAASGISVWSPKAAFPELSPVVYGGGLGRSSYRGHELLEHGGNVPGYNSQISRLQNDNIGVAVLSNDNSYGGTIVDIIKCHILDTALGLEPIDWNARYKGIISQATSSAPVPAARPANASLPVGGLKALAGKYTHPAYGDFEFCPFPSSNNTAVKSCRALASAVPQSLPGAVNPAIPTFLVTVDSPWATHLRFAHFDQAVFNVSVLRSTPTGNATAPYWTFDPDEFTPRLAEFSDGGIGLRGFWGEGNEVPTPEGNTPRERAEVWLERARA
ncbi:hypothetical protein Hypma_003858 [Hypsizygus marmoreus]|uniref:Beta-lactamase-related domain-containing protein n=1 Tax=Hypsizygus marmoreus TaxID=39966 RepID=A0A369K9H3_HYPMA|nr:hypothetical protein Hypma_003858 [Hypsizygus marmoreus]